MMGIYENQEVYVVLFDLDEGMAYIPLDEYLTQYRLYAEDNKTSQYNRIFRFEDDLPERLAIVEEKYKGLYMATPIDGDPESYRVLKPSHYYNYVRLVTDDSAIKEDDQWVYLRADQAILEKVDPEFWDVMQLDPSEVNQFVLRVHKESQLVDGKVYFVSEEDPTFVYYISQNHYDFREATADDERPFPNEDQIIGDFEDISLQIEEELGMLPWEVQDMRHYLEIVIYDSEYQSPEFEDAYSEIMYLIDEFNYPETQLDEDLRVLIDDEEFRANVKEYILGE